MDLRAMTGAAETLDVDEMANLAAGQCRGGFFRECAAVFHYLWRRVPER